MQKVLQDFVGKYKDRVDETISTELNLRLQEVTEISPHLIPIIEAMQELSVGGKRLRAMLVILGYELGGGKVNDSVIQAAAMMEIFHLGLLIQDDFMDRDEMRRGVKTLIARYPDRHVGNFISMLAGDYTFGWCIEVLSNLKSPITNSQIVNAMRVWGKYFTRVGYGQTLDGLAIADEATILQILELKSGEYTCVLPLELGATLGGAEHALVKQLREYGMQLGWVFQLRDDWLAEYGDTVKTGKPVGNDSREGKRTFATMKGKEATEQEIDEHMLRAKDCAMGNLVLISLVEWVGTRDH